VLATAEPPSRSRDVVIDFSAPSADAGWWEVVELHTLTLAHNSLGTLPEAVGTLQSLTLLDVSNNKLTHVRVTTQPFTARVTRTLPPLSTPRRVQTRSRENHGTRLSVRSERAAAW